MIRLQRGIGLLALVALLLGANIAFSQEVTPESTPDTPAESLPQDDTVRVVGSGIVIPTFESLASGSGSASLDVTVTGTARGFEAFCSGIADITLAPRAMSDNEFAACTTNGSGFVELLIGYNAMSLISSESSAYGTCFNLEQLNVLFAPSASGQVTNWRQVNPESPANALSLIVPPDTAAAFVLLDDTIDGDGVRADVSIASTADAVAAVTADPNALAVVNYAELLTLNAAVRTVQINGNAAGCISPTAETIENGTYVGATPLFAYVNPNSLSKAGLVEALESVFSADVAAELVARGIVAPLDSEVAINVASLSDTVLGRTFSAESVDFAINPSVAGFVNVAGSAAGRDYLSAVTGSFVSLYPSVTTTVNLNGQVGGVRDFCNGTVEFAVIESDLTEEQLASCTENNIVPFEIELGSQATVLAAAASSDYLECLSTDALTTAFAAASANEITTWNQVDAAFPEANIYLFTPNAGDPYVDLMMVRLQGSDIPSRVDEPVTQLNASADYRAAAVANTQGALGLFSWVEFQSLDPALGLMPVSINVDGSCVAPGTATIADGTYPLSRSLRLVVGELQLTRDDVQSLLWFMAADENYGLFETSGLSGIPFTAMADLRVRLQDAFDAAELAAATPAEPEATDEPDAAAEATPEAEATEEGA